MVFSFFTACGIQNLHCSALRAQNLKLWAAREGFLKTTVLRDFPDCPVVKTPSFHRRGHGVRYLAGKLRSHKLCAVAKKIVKINIKIK